jgi:hypothetical protein
MDFRIEGLSPDAFQPLFSLGAEALVARGARRRIADHKPGFPCRVSLEDAELGEEMILVNYEHHAVDSPYRAAGPIYVRRAAQRFSAINTVPAMFRHRLMSFRSYDARGMMVASDVRDGTAFEAAVESLFGDPSAAYVHVHNAKPGCFACRVDRA